MNIQPDYSAYPVLVGETRGQLKDWLERQAFSRYLVLCDVNTHKHCLPLIQPLLPDGTPVFVIEPTFPGGSIETAKTLETCERLWTSMLEAGLGRDTCLVNLGGGVVGDLGGFCAAVYKRGIPFIQIPTTLLAMTDAALGGKLGVDFKGLKNILGVVVEPAAVFIDPVFLKALPRNELYSGYAEVLKHALIGERALWEKVRALDPAQNIEREQILGWLTASIDVKLRIVSVDPYEKGLRKLLNFGHTTGHAIESWFLESGKPIPHGEAVAMGMIAEAFIQKNERLESIVEAVVRLFEFKHLPEQSFEDLWKRMANDKKNTDGKVTIAVPGKEAFELELLYPDKADIFAALRYLNGLL